MKLRSGDDRVTVTTLAARVRHIATLGHDVVDELPLVRRHGGEGGLGRTLLESGDRAVHKSGELRLARIARGEIEFAVGYSEPGAGSDLLAMRMKAEDRGDHYLVNGHKIFNTHAHQAEYHWLAVRTDPEAPNHKAISILLVDPVRAEQVDFSHPFLQSDLTYLVAAGSPIQSVAEADQPGIRIAAPRGQGHTVVPELADP